MHAARARRVTRAVAPVLQVTQTACLSKTPSRRTLIIVHGPHRPQAEVTQTSRSASGSHRPAVASSAGHTDHECIPSATQAPKVSLGSSESHEHILCFLTRRTRDRSMHPPISPPMSIQHHWSPSFQAVSNKPSQQSEAMRIGRAPSPPILVAAVFRRCRGRRPCSSARRP